YAILPRAAMLMAAAGTAVALKNAQLGQSGFLTAGLIGLALVFLERRPVLAGIFIGLLIYKPHFGILFPLALVAGRQWKAFASAAATVLLLAAIATIAFGAHVWSAFFASLHGFDGTLTADPGFEIGFQSLFGLLRWYGASPLLALSAHMVFAALLTVLVCTLWWLPTPYPLKAAALCIGAVAVTPYVLAYDLCALAMAVAFFVQDGLRRGFYAGERVTLLVCFMLAAFLARPFGALLDAVLIGVVVWRLVAERRELRAFAGAPVSL
ncbi:MAG: glycosyltransferase family 87 protein, partial [Thiohalocapsa sp.]